MRQENLTVIKGGMTRLRQKGAALKDSAYRILNGYVTTEKTVVSRPGSVKVNDLNAATVGMVAFDGGFHTFASSVVAVPSGWTLHILRAPDGEALSRIHFAEPFLGALYVAAEFADGDIYHFWLVAGSTWEANTNYRIGDYVIPSTPNGFVYVAERILPAYPIWTPDTPVTEGYTVQSDDNPYLSFVVETIYGDTSRTGSVEPDWDVYPGEAVVEDIDGAIPQGTTIPGSTPPGTPPSVDDNYNRHPRHKWPGRDDIAS